MGEPKLKEILEILEILEKWAKEEAPGENRREAQRRIIFFLLNPLQHDLLLSYLNLTSLPDIFDKGLFPSKLYKLDLGNNHLTSFPEHIDQLQCLRYLSLYNNRLTSVPDQIGKLKYLETLLLFSNCLTSISEKIGELQYLINLELSENRLTSVPDQIGQLKNLCFLYLNDNSLNSLPNAITQLENLTVLSLSKNSLTSLPNEIGKLKELTCLKLEDNSELRSLPISLHELTECCIYIKRTGLLEDEGTCLEQLWLLTRPKGPRIFFSTGVEENPLYW